MYPIGLQKEIIGENKEKKKIKKKQNDSHNSTIF
jgi:hypothetical protein